MDPILDEFLTDLTRLRRLLGLLETINLFSTEESRRGIKGKTTQENTFLDHAKLVLSKTKESHSDLVILPGTLVLYLGGRFEFFVRTEFEHLCELIANHCGNYQYLPQAMRNNIVRMTGKVIAEPKKYGHDEQVVRRFILNLSNTLNGNMKESGVNSTCLSVTDRNMRADMLSDLFQRIGAKRIWEKIGQQHNVQVFFETTNVGEATNNAQTFINEFMDTRNKIAHPSAEMYWPSAQKVSNQISYFETIAQAISDIMQIYETELSTDIQHEMPPDS